MIAPLLIFIALPHTLELNDDDDDDDDLNDQFYRLMFGGFINMFFRHFCICWSLLYIYTYSFILYSSIIFWIIECIYIIRIFDDDDDWSVPPPEKILTLFFVVNMPFFDDDDDEIDDCSLLIG